VQPVTTLRHDVMIPNC